MVIIESVGNLLTAKVEALVNTINTVGIMGKGIALQFNRAYPNNFMAYSAACKRGEVRLGRMFVYELGQLEGPRFIINFPMKGHWKSRSRLSDIRAGLHDLKRVVQELSIASIAVSPLGCGNGELKWDDVKPTIEAVLGDLHNVDISLYVPAGSPAAVAMPVRTRRPNMTRTHAALLLAFERNVRRSVDAGLAFEEKLSLLEAHKELFPCSFKGTWKKLLVHKPHQSPLGNSNTELRHSYLGYVSCQLEDRARVPESAVPGL